MPIWTATLQRARRDDQIGYIIYIFWSSYEKDIGGRKSYVMLTSSRRQHPGHRAHTAREPYPSGPHPQADPATGRNAPAQVNAAGGQAPDARRGTNPARVRDHPAPVAGSSAWDRATAWDHAATQAARAGRTG
jgi:hypothetical protein